MLRNRLLTLAWVGSCLGLLHAFAPAAPERVVWLYLLALPLGYGHLLGAAVFARSRRVSSGAPPASRRLAAAFAASSALSLLALYAWSLGVRALVPWVVVPMLLLSVWHIVENDLALGRAYRSGLRLGPLVRSPRHQLLALVPTAGVGIAALATEEGAVIARAWFGATLGVRLPIVPLDELVAAVLIYHAVSWLIFFEDRARALAASGVFDGARLRRSVLALHAGPLVLNAALYWWLPALYVWVASPLLYLFWSALHALHTAALRGFEPRQAAA